MWFFLQTKSSDDNKSIIKHENKGFPGLFWNAYPRDDLNLFVLLLENGLTEANSGGKLYLFQPKYVFVI